MDSFRADQSQTHRILPPSQLVFVGPRSPPVAQEQQFKGQKKQAKNRRLQAEALGLMLLVSLTSCSSPSKGRRGAWHKPERETILHALLLATTSFSSLSSLAIAVISSRTGNETHRSLINLLGNSRRPHVKQLRHRKAQTTVSAVTKARPISVNSTRGWFKLYQEACAGSYTRENLRPLVRSDQGP